MGPWPHMKLNLRRAELDGVPFTRVSRDRSRPRRRSVSSSVHQTEQQTLLEQAFA